MAEVSNPATSHGPGPVLGRRTHSGKFANTQENLLTHRTQDNVLTQRTQDNLLTHCTQEKMLTHRTQENLLTHRTPGSQNCFSHGEGFG